MREIKFRVFDRCHKRMHVVGEDTHDSLTCYDGEIQYYNLQNGEGSGEHGDYTLMQFTGLKDKNGTEIYEGDIYHMGDPQITYTVVWHDSGLIGKQNGGSSYAGLSHWKDRIEIISNIYESELSEESSC